LVMRSKCDHNARFFSKKKTRSINVVHLIDLV
jgi:hypothetical protein